MCLLLSLTFQKIKTTSQDFTVSVFEEYKEYKHTPWGSSHVLGRHIPGAWSMELSYWCIISTQSA